MPLLLFLDTNVFLSFFHLSKDDLEALRQLTELVTRKRVSLLLPDQVIHEFGRNRDGKVSEAIKLLEQSKLPDVYPRLSHDYSEYGQLREKLAEYEDLRRAVIEKVRSAAPRREFLADRTTSELIGVATVIEVSSEVLQRADQRYRRGNPPGKQDRKESLGDAINWEALLGYGAEGDLYMVAEDLDWASPLDPTTFNSYLQDEWRSLCKGEVHFYQRLKGFLDDHYPDIKLTSEKDALIEELASTRNFRDTHQVIARLNRVGAFDSAQLNSILAAAATNDQIFRILDDPDVKKFFLDNLENRGDELDPKLLEYLVQLANTHSRDEDLNSRLGLLLAFVQRGE